MTKVGVKPRYVRRAQRLILDKYDVPAWEHLRLMQVRHFGRGQVVRAAVRRLQIQQAEMYDHAIDCAGGYNSVLSCDENRTYARVIRVDRRPTVDELGYDMVQQGLNPNSFLSFEKAGLG